MMPRRARARRWALAVLAAGLVQGCALLPVMGDPPLKPPVQRVLLVARASMPENRPIAENAAELLAAALRESGSALEPRDFLREAATNGTALWGPRLVERVQRGGWPTPEEGGELLGRFGISTVLAVEVTAYDQVWGKYAKFTRVGVQVQAFHVPTGTVIWRVHRDTEVEDKRGRAFRYALEQVVAELVSAIDPQVRFSLVDAWRSWRR
jgi:hypothetical protein